MVRNPAKKTSRRKNPSRAYDVVVSNLGTVYSGGNPVLANKWYGEYVKQSKGGTGRVGGERVVLMVDGEITREHFGDYDY
jgi:hypothetical protein